MVILTRLKRLVGTSVKVLRARCVHWTKPLSSSLPFGTIADLGRSRSELMAENALLRQQLIILKRQVKRPTCTHRDRIFLVLLARAVRAWKQALFLVQPETLLRWHREAFRLCWKHKSKAYATQPRISPETIALIKEMAAKNRLWGAERIRGELLKLGIQVCKRTVQKYMRSAHGSSNSRHGEWFMSALPDHRPTLGWRNSFGKPLLMGKHRSTSFVITIANLGLVSLVWLQPVP